MKLLYCEIDGFGKLRRARVDFNGTLSAFCAENGWGKSTLATFLKCMFYGVGDNRTRAAEQSDRKKYSPWQGGGYGGAVTFSYRGKTYRLERSFGKTPAEDIAKLYDVATKLLCYDFGDDLSALGEKLFGLDKDGFERTIYFPQNALSLAGGKEELTADIKAGLLNTFCNEKEGVDGGIARLEEAERALKKRRPFKGKIDEVDDRLFAVAEYRAKLQTLTARLSEQDGSITEWKAKLSKLNAQIAQAEKAVYARSVDGTANRALRELIQTAEQELASLRAFFLDPPETLDITPLEGAIERYYALPVSRETQKREEKSRKRFPVFSGLLALLSLALGFVFRDNLPVFLSFFGTTCLFGGVFFAKLFKRGKKGQNAVRQSPAPAVLQNSDEKEELKTKIQARLSRFRLTTAQDYRGCLFTIRETLALYASKKSELTRLYSSLPTENENAFGGLAALKVECDGLQREKEELSTVLARAIAQRESLEREADELRYRIEEEDELLAEKARLEKKLNAIRVAKNALLKAQANLAGRYLRPVEAGAKKYLEKLSSTIALQLDGEGKTFVDEGGFYRETERYSLGTRGLIGLCVRLALVDELYLKEQPFLVFDDPFVNLDDKTLAAVKTLLKEESAHRQIVYFTCRKDLLF